MLLSFFAAMLVSSEAPAPVAVMPLQVRRANARTSQVLDDLLVGTVTRLTQRQAVGRNEIGSLIGQEKLQQSLSCDTLECMADIAKALDAQQLIAGNVSRMAGTAFVSLALIDVSTAVVRKRTRVEVIEERWEGAMERSVRELFGVEHATLTVSLGDPPAPPAWFCAETTTGTDVCARGWLQCNVEARAWGGQQVDCKQAERVFCQTRQDAEAKVDVCHASLSACRHWSADTSVVHECEASDAQWALGPTP